MPRSVLIVLGLLGLIASAVSLLGCTSAMSLVPVKGPPKLTPEGVQVVRFASSPGIELEGRLYPAQPPSAGNPNANPNADPEATVIFCHGVLDNNASIMAAMFRRAGYRVFQFDYRAFGNSTKAPITSTGLTADTLAAIDYLRSRPDINASKLLLAGHSLGATQAIAAAATLEARGTPVRAVLACAGYSNTNIVANSVIPVLGLLIGGVDGPQPSEFAARIVTTPFMIAHPQDDGIIPVWHAEQLAKANWSAGGRALLLILPTGGHISAFTDYPSFETAMTAWLNQHLAPTPPKDWPDPIPRINDRDLMKNSR